MPHVPRPHPPRASRAGLPGAGSLRRLLPLVALLAACVEADVDATDPGARRRAVPPPAADAPPLPDAPEILAAIAALPGVTMHEVYATYDGATAVRVSLRQPVDHANPDGPTFEQYLTLRHVDVDAPMALLFFGYSDGFGATEMILADTLGANQISVEKRYFGSSRPDGDIDWTTMTADQIAADNHAIVETFRALYTGPWVSEGYSQGGIDALVHRMRYPDDITGTLASGTPLVMSLADDRARAFFDDPPDADCQARLEDIRAALLTPEADGGLKEAAVELGAAYYADHTFERVGGVEVSVGMYLVEFPWVFWMYASANCAALPDPAEAPDDALAWGMAFYGADHSDQNLEGDMGGYWVQVSTQTGYPLVPLDGAEHLVDPDWPAYYELLPLGAEPRPFVSLSAEMQAWITDDADDVLLTYGDHDPFVTMGPDVTGADPTVTLHTLVGGDHTATVFHFPADERAALEATIHGWVE